MITVDELKQLSKLLKKLDDSSSSNPTEKDLPQKNLVLSEEEKGSIRELQDTILDCLEIGFS